MTEQHKIPDAWPPPEELGRVVPLFPLPNVFLFPGTVMPLHVFEPRYRKMVEDSLDGPGRLVIGTVLDPAAGDLAGAPPVLEIAGLGEIARHEKLPDGRFLILVVGLERVRIHEVPSEEPYRLVEASSAPEVPVRDEAEEGLRERLQAAVLERANELLNLPEDIPIGHLTDLLLLKMQLPPQDMREMYGTLEVARRARRALEEHVRRPIPPPPEPGEDGLPPGNGELEG